MDGMSARNRRETAALSSIATDVSSVLVISTAVLSEGARCAQGGREGLFMIHLFKGIEHQRQRHD